MNSQSPIFTEKSECQDCYKCVRNCPVKAIRVEGGYASVIPELCIVCGHCVEVCPNGAKKVRNDLAGARLLLKSKRAVLVSLAPSYVTEFPGVKPAQIVGALKQLRFSGVSETALGGWQVFAHTAVIIGRSLAQSESSRRLVRQRARRKITEWPFPGGNAIFGAIHERCHLSPSGSFSR